MGSTSAAIPKILPNATSTLLIAAVFKVAACDAPRCHWRGRWCSQLALGASREKEEIFLLFFAAGARWRANQAAATDRLGLSLRRNTFASQYRREGRFDSLT